MRQGTAPTRCRPNAAEARDCRPLRRHASAASRRRRQPPRCHAPQRFRRPHPLLEAPPDAAVFGSGDGGPRSAAAQPGDPAAAGGRCAPRAEMGRRREKGPTAAILVHQPVLPVAISGGGEGEGGERWGGGGLGFRPLVACVGAMRGDADLFTSYAFRKIMFWNEDSINSWEHLFLIVQLELVLFSISKVRQYVSEFGFPW